MSFIINDCRHEQCFKSLPDGLGRIFVGMAIVADIEIFDLKHVVRIRTEFIPKSLESLVRTVVEKSLAGEAQPDEVIEFEITRV